MELAIGIIVGLLAGAAGAVAVARVVLAGRLASARRERDELIEEAVRSADATPTRGSGRSSRRGRPASSRPRPGAAGEAAGVKRDRAAGEGGRT